MVGSNLFLARLVQANMVGANLIKANLIKANLTEANLDDANLAEANLEGVKLDGALFNESTTWPDGLDYTSRGSDTQKLSEDAEPKQMNRPISE